MIGNQLGRHDAPPRFIEVNAMAMGNQEAAEANATALDDKHGVGFNLEAAIATFHAEALKAGAVPDGDARAADPMGTAMAHDHGKGPHSCRKPKCRVGGFCYALKELIFFQRGQAVAAPFITAADETETVR